MVAQLIQTLAPAPQQPQAPGQTDEQIAEMRRYIESLRGAKEPVHSWTQGASNLVGDVVGALSQKKINDAQQGRQGQTDEYAAMLARGADSPPVTPAGGAATPPVPSHVATLAVPPSGAGGSLDPVTRMAAVVNTGETGRGTNFGPEALGNISPDTHGSKSYGFMGLNSKTGSAGEFSKKYGPQLGITAEPGTPEFDAQWKVAAHTRPDDMRAAQMDHFKTTQVDPVYQDLQRWGIPTSVASDPRVQAYFADRHVQMGKLGLQNAATAWQSSGGDPEKFLRNMNQIDGSPEMLQKYFPNALAQGVYSPEGHATRLNKRLSGALGLSAGDATNAELPGASTPTGGGNTSDMVRALSGNTQMAQAGPQAGQPAAAGGNLQSEYFQHLHNFVHMGYTMPQADALATRMVEARKGFLPTPSKDEYGNVWMQSPGRVPQLIQPGQGKVVDYEPVKDIHRRYIQNIAPDGKGGFKLVETPFTPSALGGADPGATGTPVPARGGLPASTQSGAPPTSQPGAQPAPTGPLSMAPPATGPGTPPIPKFPGENAPIEELQDWLAKVDAIKKGRIAGQEDLAKNAPENIAAATNKTSAEEQAKTDVKYFDTLYKGITGSGTIAAQQKQNIDVLRQIANNKDFVPGFGSDAALGLQRLAAQFGINPAGAAPREVFNQIAARVLADQFSGMKSMASETGEAGGRIFKSMLDVEEKANITPSDTLEGVKAKLNLLDKTGDLMMKWADLADDYKAKHGKLDAGFNKQLRASVADSRIQDLLPKVEEKAPKEKVQPSPSAPDPLAAAREAISRGAPRDKVIERLKSHGIEVDGL